MKVLLFNVCFLAVTFARPDVAHLNLHNNEHVLSPYHIPSTNYGVPLVNNYGAHVHGSTPSYVHIPNYNEHHQQHVTYGRDYGVHTNYPSHDHPSYGHQEQHVTYGRDHGVHTNYPSYGSQEQHVSYQHDNNYGKDQYYSGAEKVEEEKHVYFYSAPDVLENRPRLKVHIVPQHKKNTNVLYVKVPDYAVPIPEVVAPPSHVEDKTKVYVLVKDPKEYAPIVYNAPAVVKTSHPELFVVPYKNEHDVEQVISGDHHGHTYGSVGHQYDDQLTFVKSINSESNSHFHNDKVSHVHPNTDLNVYAKTHAPAVPSSFLRFADEGETHDVKTHHVVTHHDNKDYDQTHHGNDLVNTHHVVTSLVPNIPVGTHSVHTLGGPVSSDVHYNSGVSVGSSTISPLHSIIPSITPNSGSVSGSNFVSSTIPTVVLHERL